MGILNKLCVFVFLCAFNLYALQPAPIYLEPGTVNFKGEDVASNGTLTLEINSGVYGYILKEVSFSSFGYGECLLKIGTPTVQTTDRGVITPFTGECKLSYPDGILILRDTKIEAQAINKEEEIKLLSITIKGRWR